jgi:transposase-like protein
MSNSPIEILGARERRRRWRVDEKLRIVAEAEEPGASLRAVAARHDVYPTLLGTWRRQMRRGELVAEGAVRLLPVRVAEPGPAPTTTDATGTVAPTAVTGTIEISLPDGSRVRVGNDVSLAALRRVMAVLRG